MRKGFTLTEMMVVIIILPFVMFLLDGLFGTLLTEIPRSCRMAQQGSMLLGLLEQIHRDVGQAKSLPAEFAGRTAGDALLLVELPEGVIGYQVEEGHVARSKLTSAAPGEPEQERVWSIPNSKIEWQVWQKDGAPSLSLRARPELVEGTPARAGPNGADRVLGGYAVEVKSHVELKVHGRMEKKMARTHLFYGGVLR